MSDYWKEAFFRVGDTVRPQDARRDNPEFTFPILDESQIEYWPRAGKFMIYSGTGLGFWEESLELVPEEVDDE